MDRGNKMDVSVFTLSEMPLCTIAFLIVSPLAYLTVENESVL
jgi:hypothetical protein